MLKPFIFSILCLTYFNLNAGELDPGQQDWYDHYKKQANIPAFDAMLLNTDPEPDLSGEFVSLFNGKDLTGWTPRGGKCEFEVVDGTLVGTVVKGSPSTYLSTNKEDYANFVFTCELKWEVDSNSGVMFRAQRKEGKKGETVFGPQAEMESEGKNRGWSGGIYGQSAGGWHYPLWLKAHEKARNARKNGDWNRITIQTKGNVVKTWVNGVPAAHWVNDTYLKGFFALQIHSGKEGKVHFRDIRVQEISE